MPNSIFDQPQFEDYRQPWAARIERYQLYRAYYAGSAYDDLKNRPNAKHLYTGTRTLFSPIRRAVRVEPAVQEARPAPTATTPSRGRERSVSSKMPCHR